MGEEAKEPSASERIALRLQERGDSSWRQMQTVKLSNRDWYWLVVAAQIGVDSLRKQWTVNGILDAAQIASLCDYKITIDRIADRVAK